jgi:ubiquinone/menaquinone biosynthesis C-methylase UbiE
VGVAVLVAVIVAGFNHEKVSHLAFYTTTVGAGILTFLIVNYIRTVLLLPPRDDDVMQPDPATLTASITSAVRSTYAISSNWLSLWRSPNFRYYLHLDAAASLIAYSDRFNSYLLRISRDEKDLNDFWAEGLDLLDKIAADDIPVYKHRLRLLIYPEWVYTVYKSEMDQLIQSHGAARIPCIPLVAEELYQRLARDEHDVEDVAELVTRLGQDFLDKAPPRPPTVQWFISQRLKLNFRLRPPWRIVFPDMLLVDVGISHDTSAAWWYDSDGAITRRGYEDTSGDFAKAECVFRIICKHARQALWNDYTPGKLGGVAIAASTGGLQSEIFFAREYYGKWLDWITTSRTTDQNARQLADWQQAERVLLAEFVKDAISATNGNTDVDQTDHPIRLLDVGCGVGRDIIDLLHANSELHAVGVDIIEGSIKEGTSCVYKEGLGDRAALFVGDAEALTEFGEREFDIAIYMTNTLGNLTPEKQERSIRQLKRVLTPTGRAFISVYSDASVRARMASYRAIGLRVENREDHIDAAEGLRSQHFTAASLRTLLEKNGLTVVDAVKEVTPIGLAAVATPTP